MTEPFHDSLEMPNAHFEEFRFSDDSKQTLQRIPKQAAGKLSEIRAHTATRGLVIRYEEIGDIETAFAGEEFRGERLPQGMCAVSFRPRIKISARAGKIHERELTRVTYWNITDADLSGLLFLKNTADKKLFLAACRQPDFLLKIAIAHLEENAQIAAAAYRRALVVLQGIKGWHEDAMLQLLSLSAAALRYNLKATAERALADYRRFDKCGEGGIHLARFFKQGGKPMQEIEEILTVSVALLLKNKPRQYSAKLGAALDFIVAENLTAPAPGQLLWQTYLAASAEREITVLRQIWVRAVELKADRETLRIIYRTWHGFTRRREGTPRKISAKPAEIPGIAI